MLFLNRILPNSLYLAICGFGRLFNWEIFKDLLNSINIVPLSTELFPMEFDDINVPAIFTALPFKFISPDVLPVVFILAAELKFKLFEAFTDAEPPSPLLHFPASPRDKSI